MKNKANNQSLDKARDQRGFTLIGLVIVVLVVVVLATAAFIWIDPATHIGNAKDRKRQQDVLAIANAISEYVNDHHGALPVLGAVTTDKKTLCRVQGGSTIVCGGDTKDCLRIAHEDFYNGYLADLPIDPAKTANTDTGYYLEKDSNGMLVVGACSTTGAAAVTKTTNIKVNCAAYAGGHCWYLSNATGKDCNNYCAELGLVCVEKAKYASDVDSGASGYCELNEALEGDTVCNSGCVLTTTDSPGNYDGASTCIYREYPLDCTQKDVNYYNLCPCQ